VSEEDDILQTRLAALGLALDDGRVIESVDFDELLDLLDGNLGTERERVAVRNVVVALDPRPLALIRAELSGREAVRRALLGPMTEPPPRGAIVPPGPSSPHLVKVRDVLWEAFGALASAEGKSVDDLVNDAMARYRSVHEFVGGTKEPSWDPRDTLEDRAGVPAVTDVPASAESNVSAATQGLDAVGAPEERTDVMRPPRTQGLIATVPIPAVQTATPTNRPVPSLGTEVSGSAETLRPSTSASEPTPMLPSILIAPDVMSSMRNPSSIPPAPEIALIEPMQPEALRAASPDEPTSPKLILGQPAPLFVTYLGKRHEVRANVFVIGREPATCHLVITDANVSRKHAIVEFVSGKHYLVDQGSTNGVGSGGHRIHRKQIVEGDQFEICGHSLTFSFRL
jgi:hypothetical protein